MADGSIRPARSTPHLVDYIAFGGSNFAGDYPFGLDLVDREGAGCWTSRTTPKCGACKAAAVEPYAGDANCVGICIPALVDRQESAAPETRVAPLKSDTIVWEIVLMVLALLQLPLGKAAMRVRHEYVRAADVGNKAQRAEFRDR